MPYTVISKPRRFKAVQWTGRNYAEVRKFLGGNCNVLGAFRSKYPLLIARTVTTEACVFVNSWVVRDGDALLIYRAEEFGPKYEIEIEHLIDITCSWELEELGGRRLYMIAPGYAFADLTPYEQHLLAWSEAYMKRENKE